MKTKLEKILDGTYEKTIKIGMAGMTLLSAAGFFTYALEFAKGKDYKLAVFGGIGSLMGTYIILANKNK